jgi:hypothetical protein
MISPPRPVAGPSPLSREDRWRQVWLVVLAATLVLLTVVAVGRPSREPGPPGNAAAAVSPPPSPAVSAAATPVTGGSAAVGGSPEPVAPSPSPPAAPQLFPADGVLRLDGGAPVRASGEFDLSNERSLIAGAGGTVRRFKVAVERGSGEDVAAFAAQVWAVLSDERSWIGAGSFRLQMVAAAEPADFTVYLATRETAGRMCELGGTDIRVGGVPYTSCRTTGKAIINLDRWRGSAQPYVSAGAGLAAYRQYVINHEVGHEFGHRHEGCPTPGGPAPVMVQQTLTLRGCVPYSWPRHDGRSLAGPPV